MTMHTHLTFLFLTLIIMIVETQKSTGKMSIVVKDVGVAELNRDDVAMIFYVTVTNTGHEPIHLAINGTKCCQKITENDEDCESMKLMGGEMGELFPQDSRNLTLLYVNLYPHDREGSCEVLITDNKDGAMTQTIKFNTRLVRGEKVQIPRLLKNYYDSTIFEACDSVDKDPLNSCKPYICDIRYDGYRSLYNYTTERCEKIPKCIGDNENDLIAYDVESGTCKRVKLTITEEDFAQFKEGKPSILTLEHDHGYPINVRCHHGKVDKKGHWCECDEGWSSAPFDYQYFNPDIQVYHMCTVWKGEMTAEQARNISTLPKSQHKKQNILIFTFLAASFFLLFPIFGYLCYKLRLDRRAAQVDALDESETAKLTDNIYEDE